MAMMIIEKKQENGRYAPIGEPVTDPGYVYKCLCKSLYKHHLYGKANRIQAKEIDSKTMQFTVTYPGNLYRSIYTVHGLNSR